MTKELKLKLKRGKVFSELYLGTEKIYTRPDSLVDQCNVQDYPANTVRGRVCLGLRLDWDADTTKETSDIYVKQRAIVIAWTSGWFIQQRYIIHK